MSEDEIKALYSLPPNFAGVLITYIVHISFVSILTMIETILTPLVTDVSMTYSSQLTFDQDYAVFLFIIMGISGFLAFMAF